MKLDEKSIIKPKKVIHSDSDNFIPILLPITMTSQEKTI